MVGGHPEHVLGHYPLTTDGAAGARAPGERIASLANSPARVKQADVTKVLKGAVAAGVHPTLIEVDSSGTIRLFTKDGADTAQIDRYEEWKEARG